MWHLLSLGPWEKIDIVLQYSKSRYLGLVIYDFVNHRNFLNLNAINCDINLYSCPILKEPNLRLSIIYDLLLGAK